MKPLKYKTDPVTIFYNSMFKDFFESVWPVFSTSWVTIVPPNGYELVEKPEHKKERVEQEVKDLKDRREALLQATSKCEQLIKEAEEELKNL